MPVQVNISWAPLLRYIFGGSEPALTESIEDAPCSFYHDDPWDEDHKKFRETPLVDHVLGSMGCFLESRDEDSLGNEVRALVNYYYDMLPRMAKRFLPDVNRHLDHWFLRLERLHEKLALFRRDTGKFDIQAQILLNNAEEFGEHVRSSEIKRSAELIEERSKLVADFNKLLARVEEIKKDVDRLIEDLVPFFGPVPHKGYASVWTSVDNGPQNTSRRIFEIRPGMGARLIMEQRERLERGWKN